MEKQAISEILAVLPKLKASMDLESNVKFEIMKDNIASSYLICSIIGSSVLWNQTFKLS